ncbi:unnamed protein product, partial [Timema podura]|nr:unnamed protein product [Timema podura]
MLQNRAVVLDKMSNTSLENKIKDLQARLQAENEARERDRHRDMSSATLSPRQRSAPRPRELVSTVRPDGTPTRPRKPIDLPMIPPQKHQDSGEMDSKLKEIMQMNGILIINKKRYQTEIKDLEDLGELGNGTCGHVVKMLHKPSGVVIAVKVSLIILSHKVLCIQIIVITVVGLLNPPGVVFAQQMRRSGNMEENKRIIMDIDVVLKSHDCPYIVKCLGCFITDSDVWICMELMATCFDKLLKRLRRAIPEELEAMLSLKSVCFASLNMQTVKALHYLKEVHGVIHRDVKPSNILLDEKGNVKLCDFGISGRLVDSKARTRSAGCAAYMAPERIDPPDPKKPDYDIRADVWSLGITLVELATGMFPYKDCKNDFEVLARVLENEPPSLPADQNFSPDFRNFINC